LLQLQGTRNPRHFQWSRKDTNKKLYFKKRVIVIFPYVSGNELMARRKKLKAWLRRELESYKIPSFGEGRKKQGKYSHVDHLCRKIVQQKSLDVLQEVGIMRNDSTLKCLVPDDWVMGGRGSLFT
jgi:hypothetical protein